MFVFFVFLMQDEAVMFTGRRDKDGSCRRRLPAELTPSQRHDAGYYYIITLSPRLLNLKTTANKQTHSY